MVVPMLAVQALRGISIRNPLFSIDRLCMTAIDGLTLRDRRLCLFASAAFTWLMPLCNGACPIAAIVGIALLAPTVVCVGSLLPLSCSGTCGFPSRASDHWAVGLCLLSKGAGEAALNMPHCNL